VGWWCVRVRSWHQYGGARRPRRSRFSPQSTAFEVWLGDTVATQIRPWCNRRVTGSDCLYRTTAGAHPRREAVSNRWLHPVQARGSSGCGGRQGHPCFCAPGEARTSAPIRGNVGTQANGWIPAGYRTPRRRSITSRIPAEDAARIVPEWPQTPAESSIDCQSPARGEEGAHGQQEPNQ
jgi:hypothetical protein